MAVLVKTSERFGSVQAQLCYSVMKEPKQSQVQLME